MSGPVAWSMIPPVQLESSLVSSDIEDETVNAGNSARTLQTSGRWAGMICGWQSAPPGTHGLHPPLSSLQPNSQLMTSYSLPAELHLRTSSLRQAANSFGVQATAMHVFGVPPIDPSLSQKGSEGSWQKLSAHDLGFGAVQPERPASRIKLNAFIRESLHDMVEDRRP
ncbi:MAG: hypothetical protein WKG01_17330 [Kofleriaceae bacterium]